MATMTLFSRMYSLLSPIRIKYNGYHLGRIAFRNLNSTIKTGAVPSVKLKLNINPVSIRCLTGSNHGLLQLVGRQYGMRFYCDSSGQYRKAHPTPENEPNPDPEQFNWPQLLFGVAAILIYYLLQGSDPIPQVSFPFFLKHMLKTGEVLKLEVSASGGQALVYLHPGAVVEGAELRGNTGPHFTLTVANPSILEQRLIAAQLELGVKPANFVPVIYRRDSDILPTFIASMITVAVVTAIWYFLSYRTGGRGLKGGDAGMSTFNPFSQMSRAKPTVITETTPDMIGMSDIAGMKEAKMEVMEFIDYLKSPSRFTRLGARIPKGALLHGPPGTGKTLLAKGVAGEASVPFISIAGSDFVEMFAGVGSARVRNLFQQARKLSPCILYIDEVDAIGRSRRSGAASGGGNAEQESTLNQLLVELDGIHALEGVVVMASTNRVDVLDRALLRPGRFDRQIAIELPSLSEREEIFSLYLKQLKLSGAVDDYSRRLAALTPGHSGADIANICNEAALHTARQGGAMVAASNLEYAIERVIAGMELHNNPLTAEERRVVAYHEAGHALVGWMLDNTDPVLKMSIVSRTKSVLGFSQVLPSDQQLHSREELLDRLCVALGGRAAEALTFSKVTTGAQDDLKQVTDLARRMVTVFGMSPDIGNLSYPSDQELGGRGRPYSNHLATLIDKEVGVLVRQAYCRAEAVLQDNSSKLETLAEQLLEKEVLDFSDIVGLIGPTPSPRPHHAEMDHL